MENSPKPYETSAEDDLQVTCDDQGNVLSVAGFDRTVRLPESDDQDTDLDADTEENK